MNKYRTHNCNELRKEDVDKILDSFQAKYNLSIDINSLALKNQLIEVNTKLTFDDKSKNEIKSFFFINYATVIKIKNMEDRKIMEKIILCDLQNEIYPRVEKAFLDVLKVSGFKELEIETKIDFERLYKEKFN